MQPVAFGTSPISGAPKIWTSAPRWLRGSSNLQRDEHGRLVVGYVRSTSWRSEDCASHMCIWQDSPDQFFGRSPCLATVSHNCQYSKRYLPHTKKDRRNSHQADPMSPKGCQEHWPRMAFRGWNSAVSTEASWHHWPRLEMGLCRWIPATMLPSVGSLGRGLSGTSHGCSSLIWLMSAVWNS